MTEIERINKLRLTWRQERQADELAEQAAVLDTVRIKRLNSPSIEVEVDAGVHFQRCGGGRRVIRRRVYE
jgi:hypothetical protein